MDGENHADKRVGCTSEIFSGHRKRRRQMPGFATADPKSSREAGCSRRHSSQIRRRRSQNGFKQHGLRTHRRKRKRRWVMDGRADAQAE